MRRLLSLSVLSLLLAACSSDDGAQGAPSTNPKDAGADVTDAQIHQDGASGGGAGGANQEAGVDAADSAPPPGCTDTDNDGFGVGTDCQGPQDCAPDDATRHPNATEVCNGVDDNCDGNVDEQLTQACTNLCDKPGEATCQGGVWGPCVAAQVDPETCDGQDNDCDGLVDEGLTCPDKLPRLWVFALAGQSNMVGLGVNAELGPDDNKKVPAGFIYYNDSVHTNPNADKWTDLGPGFGFTADRFGPELNFGRRVRQLWPNRAVAIIKVAEGGTALHDRWLARKGDLYKMLLNELNTQMPGLNKGWRAQLVGFVWMQGESDGINKDDAKAYHDNLANFLLDMREDVSVPILPISAGLIYSKAGLWPEADTVRGATSLLADQLGQMNVVETNDLAVHANDKAHYDTPSQLTLGKRFAESITAMLKPGWSFPGGFSGIQGDNFLLYTSTFGGKVDWLQYDAANKVWHGKDAGALIGDGWMHPGEQSPVAVTWWAPYEGHAQVKLTVSIEDKTPGDGVEAMVTDGTHAVWGPAIILPGHSVSGDVKIDVKQGKSLQFVTTSGAAHDNQNDVATWKVDIELTGMDE